MMETDIQERLAAFAAERAAFWADPPRGTCPECKQEGAILHAVTVEDKEVQLCAGCASKHATRLKSEGYPCDNCGAPNAIRDPLHRRDEYLCMKCHKEDGYEPTERAMIMKTQARVGFTHSKGRRDPCAAEGAGTECGGQVKYRGPHKMILCDKHNDPKAFAERAGRV